MLAIGRGLVSGSLNVQHFSETAGGSWVVKPDIKARVRFQSINSVRPVLGAMGQFDVIFCRNVLDLFLQ